MNKIIFFLLIPLLCNCSTSKKSLDSSIVCKELPSKISENWNVNNFTNDSFLIDLSEKYRTCFLNHDSAYIINLFGKKFYLQTAVVHQEQKHILDSLALTFSIEYNVFTPSRTEGGYNCRFFADKKGIVRYFQVDMMPKGKLY